MDPNMQDDKNMALDDLIKRDMLKKKATKAGAKVGAGGVRGKMKRTAASAKL